MEILSQFGNIIMAAGINLTNINISSGLCFATFAAMNRLVLFLVCILICLLPVIRVNGQTSKIRVDGFVTDIHGRPLAYVNIVNYKGRAGTTSDEKGTFRIFAGEGDTVVFRYMGFESARLTIPGETGSVYPVHVYMKEDTLQLSAVTIFNRPRNITELRQAVLNQKVEKPVIADLNLNAKITDLPPAGPRETLPGMGDPGLTYKISGPITMLYNTFSRRGKSLKKYEELIGKDQLRAIIDKKYNPEIIKAITGFTSDEEIEAFIEYCNLSSDFLLNASEYEILCSVKDCLASFLASKQ